MIRPSLGIPTAIRESGRPAAVPAGRKVISIMLNCLLRRLGAIAVLLTFGLGSAAGATGAARPQSQQASASSAKVEPKPVHKAKLDRSGRKQVGKASYYARKFAGRKMADGTPMKPHGDNAASKTLPLGTTARVTNLETGRSATVTVRDRGPYVPGRIIDLSPSTAREIGITREDGVAPVEVAPIDVPLADGSSKAGAGARTN
jgi:rare lipoprotein A